MPAARATSDATAGDGNWSAVAKCVMRFCCVNSVDLKNGLCDVGHIHSTHVPVEKLSTTSIADIRAKSSLAAPPTRAISARPTQTALGFIERWRAAVGAQVRIFAEPSVQRPAPVQGIRPAVLLVNAANRPLAAIAV